MPPPKLPARFAPKDKILLAAPLFEGVPAPLVAALAAGAERLVLGRGDTLWMAGDSPGAFHIVVYGAVKLQCVRPGNPLILAFFLPGESIADAMVVARAAMPASAVVQSAVGEILRLPAEALLSAERREPTLAAALRACVARQVRWLHTKIEIVTMATVEARLATFILRTVERASRSRSGPIELDFAPTRVELASMVEARAETITRALGKLARENVCTIRKDSMIVHDYDGLRRRIPNSDGSVPAPPHRPRLR